MKCFSLIGFASLLALASMVVTEGDAFPYPCDTPPVEPSCKPAPSNSSDNNDNNDNKTCDKKKSAEGSLGDIEQSDDSGNNSYLNALFGIGNLDASSDIISKNGVGSMKNVASPGSSCP